ncbi:uncharacterized protein LOC131858241 [Cryptomeria japonica]|uniref:uncharacterized protein LOC131858241 n=1 Tax=Cryptomeria japonica TaxID=3369 RepID=UPI0027DA2D49|nr:uncharacterized protein LOC131858241 [Cryptomeria japonica]
MGGLAVLWNPDKVLVRSISKQENWMLCNVSFLQDDLEFSLFNVYGPSKTEDKKRVWKEISEQIKLVDSEKVIVAGDFNAILNNEEKSGGLRMNTRVMEDFRDFVTENNLFDVIPKSGNFTWTNRRANFSRISERLDRIFTGTYWIKGQFELELSIMPITLSDHFPVQMNCSTSMAKVKRNFKFLSMWWRDINFEKTIEKWWVECADYRAKRNKNKISHLLDDSGRMVGKVKELECIAVKYFEKILGSATMECEEFAGYLLEIIDKKITEEDNAMLMAPITKDEVKKATFALHPHKAPGPDGVMVNRLKLVLEKLISPEQHGFTPDREIADSIITVVETMHSMKRSKMQGMMVKLDVSKAYDRVNRYFLFSVLERFGFDHRWINCIKHCVTSFSYSIIVNGSIYGFLQATNGLRQGDPLSPFLFVLMTEILRRNIKKLVETVLWKGVLIHGNIDPISHSQFADDTVLFGGGLGEGSNGNVVVIE